MLAGGDETGDPAVANPVEHPGQLGAQVLRAFEARLHGVDRIHDQTRRTHAVQGMADPGEDCGQLDRVADLHLVAIRAHVEDPQLPLGTITPGGKAEALGVVQQGFGRLVEGDQHALVSGGDPLAQEGQRDDGLAGAGGAAQQCGSPVRETALKDEIEPFDAGGDRVFAYGLCARVRCGDAGVARWCGHGDLPSFLVAVLKHRS